MTSTTAASSKTSHYADWANMLANFVTTYKANSGVDLYALSIQNEPNLATDYDSMIYSVTEMAAFAKVLEPKLAATSSHPEDDRR